MIHRIDLQDLLSQAGNENRELASFALLSLGVVESLVAGAMTATGAVELFFHADNCLYIHRHLKHKVADEIMSRGVQLHDLFDALPVEDAQQEFQREIAAIRALCLTLLDDQRLAA